MINIGGSGGVLSLPRTSAGGMETEFETFFIPNGERKYCEWYANTSQIPGKIEIKTHLSRHIPFNILLTPGKENIDSTITVDNEDKGFRIIKRRKAKKISSWFRKNTPTPNYTIYTMIQLPDRWRPYVSIRCYGNTIKSAVYKQEGKGENRVEWHATLPSDGHYELEVYIPVSEYNFPGIIYSYRVIRQGNGIEIPIEIENRESGWISLGEFDYKAGEVTVELTDKVEGKKAEKDATRAVIADAIRWKKISK